MSLCGVAPGGVYIDRQVAMPLVSSYLTFPPLPIRRSHLTSNLRMAVYLCCTFLEVAFTGSYPAPLPCGARTFLRYVLSELYPRLSGLLKIFSFQLRNIWSMYSSDLYNNPFLLNSQQVLNGSSSFSK